MNKPFHLVKGTEDGEVLVARELSAEDARDIVLGQDWSRENSAILYLSDVDVRLLSPGYWLWDWDSQKWAAPEEEEFSDDSWSAVGRALEK